ncbi:Sin3 complex subunit [Diplocarpon rosae]|nr:Sin3 complex subunit [Diplocarpon rosae]
MAARFIPQGYDPHMHREELLTLSRTLSQQTINGTTASPMTRKPQPLYLVEQWACSRVHPTFIIATYTGDPSHVASVGVLGVPEDEETWSPRMRVYFKAVSQYHARPKDTPKGMLMVTNLSSFPSALTVIPVPDGDITKHREDFIVNENLKRLGCSGRSGMSLSPPAGATQAKFFQLYKTSDRIPFYGAVLELVKLCQIALMMFGKLEQEYADGMLCDITEKAINDWWTEVGSDYYNIEPADGILGPTTVSALLGMFMGARNRLNWYGAPVAKDAFDVWNLRRGITAFQKSQKLERTRQLDRQTLDRLHRTTAKAAAGEGWAVPKAVKSTVAELSGKGGEMVMGMVGRDKSGIGDIETLDIDRFVSLVHGERPKWLWYGRPRKNGGTEQLGRLTEPDVANLSFSRNEHGGYIWSNNKAASAPIPDDVEMRKEKEDSPQAVYANKPPGSATNMVETPSEKDLQLRKTVLKSVSGKMSDARSGLGRIKDAVGLRVHTSRPSKDEAIDAGYYNGNNGSGTFGLPTGTPISPMMLGKTFTWKETPGQYLNGNAKVKEPSANVVSVAIPVSETPPNGSRTDLPLVNLPEEDEKATDAEAKWAEQVREIRRDVIANDLSVAGSVCDDADLEGPLLEALREPNNFQVLLHRRHSFSGTLPMASKHRDEAWWPRQMSFADAEDAVLGWEPIGTMPDDGDGSDNWAALRKQELYASDYKNLFQKINHLQVEIGPWVESKVSAIEKLDEQAATDHEQMQTLYYQLMEQYQSVKQSSQDVLGDERSHVLEAFKDIEVLGAKLEYEINALVSKVQDLEDGVLQFERQVDDLEGRADTLETELGTESWLHWLVRSITGIGTGPNITAPRRRQ